MNELLALKLFQLSYSVINYFRSMPTTATNSQLSASLHNSEFRVGCPNLGHATLTNADFVQETRHCLLSTFFLYIDFHFVQG